jgi:hypothetical protein
VFARGGFTVAFRFLEELTPKLRQEVLLFEKKVVFRTTLRDAEELAFSVNIIKPSNLTELRPDEAQTADGLLRPQPMPSLNRLKVIRKRSRARHTRSRAKVEKSIAAFFHPEVKRKPSRKW